MKKICSKCGEKKIRAFGDHLEDIRYICPNIECGYGISRDAIDYAMIQNQLDKNILSRHRTSVKQAFIMGNLRTLKRGSKILDIGCGCCIPTRYLFEYFDYRGIDKSEEALKFCRKYYNPGSFFLCDIEKENLDFEDSSFDALMMIDIIEQLHDPSKALKEIKRVLKPGGKAIILTPNYNIAWKVLERLYFGIFGKGFKPYDSKVHPFKYTKKSLKSTLSPYFRNVEVSTIYGGMILAAVVGDCPPKVLADGKEGI
ncbi:class I SAM-dependent methyltransferase [Candidatus Woesearchaeota archaeon]|nr:class I SAM-dependent methyltransferase [Candidatus Woesearchaeota archaeon]